MYYAIKEGEYKGVYISEKILNEQTKNTSGISTKIFKKGELKNALEWAGVEDIDIRNTCPIDEIINSFKNEGFYCLEIKLINNDTYTVCIRNHYYKGGGDNIWDDPYFEKIKNGKFLFVLEPNDYIVKGNFIYFKTFPKLKNDSKEEQAGLFYKYSYENGSLALDIEKIVSIRTLEHYDFGDRWLDDKNDEYIKDLIDYCKL